MLIKLKSQHIYSSMCWLFCNWSYWDCYKKNL